MRTSSRTGKTPIKSPTLSADPSLSSEQLAELAEFKAEIRDLEKNLETLRDPSEARRPPAASSSSVGSCAAPSRCMEDLRREKERLEEEYNRLSAMEEKRRKEAFRNSVAKTATPDMLAQNFRSASSAQSLADKGNASSAGARAASDNEVLLLPGSLLLEALKDPLLLLGPDVLLSKELGAPDLKWDNTWNADPAGPRDEGHRRQVRLNTREKVAKELGLAYFGERATNATRMPPQLRATHLFVDRSKDSSAGMAPAGGTNLLGRYDVCCVKVCADMDRKWCFARGHKPDFWVAHAAAINIGEYVDAADFEDFRKQENNAVKVLDVYKYTEAMGHIMDNVVQVCKQLGIQDMVFFPFGMGAFIRHVGRIDTTFEQDEEMLRLRRSVAVRMMASLAKAPKGMKVHLCLQFSTEEAQRNADAFLRAILGDPTLGKGASPLKDRVTIVPEGDVLDIANQLSAKSDKVLLLNGANRQLIGNHWFASRAKMAIDENLHRRSWRLSAMSYLLNDYDGEQDVPEREKDTLARRVKSLGGKVVELNKPGIFG